MLECAKNPSISLARPFAVYAVTCFHLTAVKILNLFFSTGCPGLFVAHVPVILNDNRDSPYRTLTLKGELLAPNLKFDPECLRLMPVPLRTPVSADFNIVARGYRRQVNTVCRHS